MAVSDPIDGWQGETFNGVPYIGSTSDTAIKCNRETFQGTDDDGNIVYANDCGWNGTVMDLELGKPKAGSQPRSLCCPDCGRRLAAKKGSTSAGYWDGKLD